MAFNPITVNKGPSAEPHIYAEDDAAIFQSMFGEDGILDIGSKLKLTIQSNNLVRMSDGALCVGGHIGRIKYADYVDLTIDNGETGYNRNDLIIGSFSNTGEHTVDTFEPKVVKGTPATGEAVDPTLTEGSLYEGDHLRQSAIARVRLEGLNIVGIDMLLPVIPSIPSLKALLDELNGKMKADDDWSAYSDNGWEMQYRHISQNQVYVEVNKTSTGNNAAIVGDLVMAGVPFTASFGQNVPVYMDVSGSIVGYGRANFATNNGLYLYTPAYGNSVSYTVFGIVTVE